MTQLELPLQWRTLRATGDVLLRAEVVLALKTNRGTWDDALFRVDSGTEMTTPPYFRSRRIIDSRSFGYATTIQ